MTQEEKARAYDEALEKARKQRDDYQKELNKADKNSQLAGLLRAGISVIEMTFPELAESEDKRTMEWLLDYAIKMIAGLESDISLSTYDGIKGHDPEAEAELAQWQKVRAYLEKQKEQKPIPANSVGLKEQKSALSEEDEIMIGSLINYFEGDALDCSLDSVVNWLKSLRPQPKQEWSEEDELKRDNLVGLVEEIKRQPLKRLEDWDGYINWLKSLPERFILQPKQEWSEEDKRCFDEAIEALKSLDFNGEASNLKSIRDRLKPLNTWKPSEEQMEAFKDYIEDFQAKAKAAVGGWNNFDVMIELYEQLKKL